ncbi:MAG: glutamine--fructose-6-phosphate transaminase (isomerizing) [Nanoarchaeota archaeon]|nr:glutamine--fructose-6-phosphate transaminase (isomerizing) [Nanoarchaeota archaeon]
MCGIIAYSGKDNAVPYLVDGIKNLEYRGYDSFGCALIDKGDIIVRKDVGDTASVLNKYRIIKNFSNQGMFHTRWATHGGISKENAHPLTDCKGEIAVVHNGIIENWQDIKASLDRHRFVSQTDTEVIPHLLEERLSRGDSMERALRAVFNGIKGASSFVVMRKGDSNMYAVKHGAPLVLGLGKNGFFVSSDIPSFLKYTNRVVFLHDGDLVIFNQNSVRIKNLLNKKYKHDVHTVDISPGSLDKGKYRHFMLKEINEQSRLLKLFENYDFSKVRLAASKIRSAHRVYLVGAGSSFHAAAYGALILRKSGIDAIAIQGQDVQNFSRLFERNDVFVIISQSGETADLIRSLQLMNGFRIGIINTEGSYLSRNVDLVINMMAGIEKAVAATKSFMNTMILLEMINSYANGSSESAMHDLKLLNLNLYSLFVPSVLSAIKRIAEELKDDGDIFYVGRDYGYLISLEGALKMKEVSYIHAEAFDLSTIKHGPLALISQGSKVIASVTEPVEETFYGLEEIKARGGHIIGISPSNSTVFDEFVHVPEAGVFSFVPLVIVAQLISYYTAVKRGINPDKPRNLAKSVTVN